MNDVFLQNSNHLMKSWKEFRKTLTSELSDREHLQSTCKFWSYAPISSRYIDWDNPEVWPTAWELINSRNFDECAIAIGMFYTLMLADDQRWSSDRLKLLLIKNQQRHVQRLVLEIDQTWYMNIEYNTVINIKETPLTLTIQNRYLYNDETHSITRI